MYVFKTIQQPLKKQKILKEERKGGREKEKKRKGVREGESKEGGASTWADPPPAHPPRKRKDNPKLWAG